VTVDILFEEVFEEPDSATATTAPTRTRSLLNQAHGEIASSLWQFSLQDAFKKQFRPEMSGPEQ
jgi:DNA-binding IscR family transcriptional regulator